jgi:ABC-type hemin transport system substrate-binding protein
MPPITRVVIGLGEADKLVGIGTWSHGYIPKSPAEAIGRGLGPKWNEVVAGLHELPDVGTGWEPSKELIVSLKPALILLIHSRRVQAFLLWWHTEVVEGSVVCSSKSNL